MIGLCYILALTVLAMISLSAYLGAMAFSATSRATDATKRADALQLELDNHKLADANIATVTAAAAEKAQEHRADDLEHDLADAEKPGAGDPAGALAELSKLSGVPGPGAGPGSPKR